MTEITCTCKVCTDNAARLGVEILGARVPDALTHLTKRASGRHGLVHLANDPHPLTGAAGRARTGVTAL